MQSLGRCNARDLDALRNFAIKNIFVYICAFLRRTETLPPNAHGAANHNDHDNEKEAVNHKTGVKRGRRDDPDQAAASLTVESINNAGMFANMFETAVGMAAEMAAQRLGIEQEEDAGGDGDQEDAGGEGNEDEEDEVMLAAASADIREAAEGGPPGSGSDEDDDSDSDSDSVGNGNSDGDSSDA